MISSRDNGLFLNKKFFNILMNTIFGMFRKLQKKTILQARSKLKTRLFENIGNSVVALIQTKEKRYCIKKNRQ